jgi:hypothetical protein
MPPVPSGPSPDQPTRILGAGHDQGCTSAPELWGTERANLVINLRGSSNVELACLEVTDRGNCVEYHCHNGECGGEVAACNRSRAPWGDWARTGVSARDSSDVVLRDVNIHGLANHGVHAGRLTDWTLERVKINANGWVGWDGSISGSSWNNGTILFVDSEIAWNGCAEDWETGKPFGCWAQGGGGYGDGLGTAETGGHWIFEGVDVHHNTSDGIDLLYLRDGGEVTIRRSTIANNAGNQVKTARSMVMENSVVIGNCSYFSDHPNMLERDMCRAMGDAVYVGLSSGSQTDLVNNTIISEGNCVVSGGGGSSQSTLRFANNLLIGMPIWNNPDRQSCLYYSGSGEQIEWESNYIHGVRHGLCPGNSICNGAPGIENDSLQEFDGLPTAGSALIAAADPGWAPETDIRNYPRGNGGGPDIGAYEHGAQPDPDPEPEPDPQPGPDPEPDPEPPVASFDYECDDLACSFSAARGGTGELRYNWSFGDGSHGESMAVEHTYSAPGDYTVELRVTDDLGQMDSTTRTVSVSVLLFENPDIRLSVRTVTERNGRRHAQLRWSGTGTGDIDIYRDDTIVASTSSYQLYADLLDSGVSNRVNYRICEHGTGNCSRQIHARF